MMCNRVNDEPIKINLLIDGLVLTPGACSSLLNELIKSLLYEKSQIPYTYTWFKNIVCKKRKSLENGSGTTGNEYTAKKYYNVISKAYDALEEIMENLSKELKNKSNHIEEVLIIFGVTPLNPKQTISIKLVNIMHDHIDVNHVQSNFRKQQNILRNLFLSDEWFKGINCQIPLTNMYVMLKKTDNNNSLSSNFTLVRNFNVQIKNYIRIELNCDEVVNLCCCKNLSIFNEETNIQNVNNRVEMDNVMDKSVSNEEVWYQSNVTFKGFKDCYINKIHASEFW